MAWSGGTFTRTNGVFTGALVWTDDKNAGTKIVSDHHDTHDQDLAQGINACLNKNGQNSPTASINWGGFKITGLANGSDTSDSATYGQTTTSATLDPTSNILTLVKAGDTDVTVDLSALAVGGSTTDFARYSNHANPFQGLATFAGTLSCDYALQLADQISGSGIYTWGLVANTSGNFGIGPLSGSDNQFILTATPSSAYASVGGNRIWDAGNLTPAAIAGMLTLDGSYTITGSWIFAATSIQLPKQQVYATSVAGTSWTWQWADSYFSLTPSAATAPLTYVTGPGYTGGATLALNNNEVWNKANMALVSAVPSGGHNNDVAIVTSGADKGVWVKLSGTWTKIV